VEEATAEQRGWRVRSFIQRTGAGRFGAAAQGVSLPASQAGNQAQQPAPGVGYDLHSHGAWLCETDGGGGREQSSDSGAPRVAITLEAVHAVEALQEAYAQFGRPDIVNTDQGSQFTAQEFVDAVIGHGVQLSMDGRGAWRDNVFVERV